MANSYYDHTTQPANNSGPSGKSSEMRTQFDNITAGFNKLPAALTAAYLLKINSAGTAHEMVEYASGSWTPVLTCGTPGNLTVVYATQIGWYVKIGTFVALGFSTVASTFTHTTASGTFRVTGLPYTPLATGAAAYTGPFFGSGFTNATYPQIGWTIDQNTYISLKGFASAQAIYSFLIGDFPTGGTVVAYGTIGYRTAS